MHEAIARSAGLTGSDHKNLGLILQHKTLTAGELSKLTGLTTGAVTGLIDRLQKKKFLKRKFTNEDRRKVIIVPHVENSMLCHWAFYLYALSYSACGIDQAYWNKLNINC